MKEKETGNQDEMDSQLVSGNTEQLGLGKEDGRLQLYQREQPTKGPQRIVGEDSKAIPFWQGSLGGKTRPGTQTSYQRSQRELAVPRHALQLRQRVGKLLSVSSVEVRDP